ncbi:MAG: M56 family metallopeptidase [Janthinobacterium lividum]
MTTLPLLKEVLSPALVRALGYALLHSVWQGGVLALLLAGVLPLLRRQRAEVRYAAAAGALASLVLVVGLTFGFYYQSAPQSAPAVAASPLAAAIAAPASPVAARVVVVASDATTPAISLTWLRANARQLEAYLPLVVVAWLLGLVLMSGRLAGGLLYASRLRRAGTQALGAEWQQRLASLARRAGVRRPVALLESGRVAGPVVLGHLRPVILLPLGAVAGLSPALLEALLAHELAHIVRRDYLLNLGLAVAEVLFFYHPAVWFMANCLRAERENCCDDQAAALCGGDGLRVARALAALAELEADTASVPRLALAAAGASGRGGLLARVRRLALGRPQAPTMSERLLAGSLTLLGLLGLSTGVVLAARPAQTVPGQTAPATSPADTARPRVAALPALPALPGIPAVPGVPAVPGIPAVPGVEALEALEAPEQIEQETRVELADNDSRVRMRRLRQVAPRRGQASTVVIEKDKKGRVVNLTVDGQRIETADKKAKRAKKVRTVEVVTVPSPPVRTERLGRSERPGAGSFSFDFSTDDLNDQALQAARESLAKTLREPTLNAEQRREIEREMRRVQVELGRQQVELQKQFRTFRFELNGLNGAAASHPTDPTYRLDRNKRGYVRLKIDKQGKMLHGDADWQVDRAAAQADRAAAQADRNAEQADRAAEQADQAASRAEAAGRRAELRARIAAAEAELRALDGSSGRSTPPRPPRAPLAPLGPQTPMMPQAPPAPPAPAAPKTAELRAALRQDGLIGPAERSFSFQLTDKGGRVNGKELTPAQVARYRQLLGQPASGQGKSSTFNINVSEN